LGEASNVPPGDLLTTLNKQKSVNSKIQPDILLRLATPAVDYVAILT
jgi:hypothetical protein